MEALQPIVTLTAEEAARELRSRGMRISPDTIRKGIVQNRFPFGDCVMDGDRVQWCYVYRKPFDRWIANLV